MKKSEIIRLLNNDIDKRDEMIENQAETIRALTSELRIIRGNLKATVDLIKSNITKK